MQTETPAVRPARCDEVPEIAAVLQAAYAEYRDRAPAAAWRTYAARTIDVAARWEDGEVLVATVGGRVAGTVTFRTGAALGGTGLPAGWASFGALGVAPAARGRGVGRALVAACVARARTARAPVLAIHTAAPMRAARRLYAGCGFRRAPGLDIPASQVEPFDPAEGDVTLLALRLDLTPPGTPSS